MKMIKYKGHRIVIKEVTYPFKYYCVNLNGYIILFLNKALSKKHKSNILHRIIRTMSLNHGPN